MSEHCFLEPNNTKLMFGLPLDGFGLFFDVFLCENMGKVVALRDVPCLTPPTWKPVSSRKSQMRSYNSKPTLTCCSYLFLFTFGDILTLDFR